MCFVEVKILIDQQSKRGFKTGKGKGGQKKYGDQQPDLRPLHRVNPLAEPRALRGVLGVGLAAFRQQTKRQNKVARAQSSGDPTRPGLPEQLCRERAQRRSENEAKPERHANEAHFFGAFFMQGHIGDVSLRNGDVGAADTPGNPRHQQNRQRCRGIVQS